MADAKAEFDFAKEENDCGGGDLSNDEWADGIALVEGQGFIVLEKANLCRATVGYRMPSSLQDGDVRRGRSDMLLDLGFGDSFDRDVAHLVAGRLSCQLDGCVDGWTVG